MTLLIHFTDGNIARITDVREYEQTSENTVLVDDERRIFEGKKIKEIEEF